MNSFFAVFVESSYTIPGDERSKQYPGHGYPEHTVTYKEVIEFESEDKLKSWIMNQEKLTFNKRRYRVVKCIPITVKSTISFNIELDEEWKN